MIGHSTLQIGLQGIAQGMQGLKRTAEEIAGAAQGDQPNASRNLAEPLVELKLYEQAVQASAKIVKTADELLGTLLDTTA